MLIGGSAQDVKIHYDGKIIDKNKFRTKGTLKMDVPRSNSAYSTHSAAWEGKDNEFMVIRGLDGVGSGDDSSDRHGIVGSVINDNILDTKGHSRHKGIELKGYTGKTLRQVMDSLDNTLKVTCRKGKMYLNYIMFRFVFKEGERLYYRPFHLKRSDKHHDTIVSGTDGTLGLPHDKDKLFHMSEGGGMGMMGMYMYGGGKPPKPTYKQYIDVHFHGDDLAMSNHEENSGNGRALDDRWTGSDEHISLGGGKLDFNKKQDEIWNVVGCGSDATLFQLILNDNPTPKPPVKNVVAGVVKLKYTKGEGWKSQSYSARDDWEMGRLDKRGAQLHDAAERNLTPAIYARKPYERSDYSYTWEGEGISAIPDGQHGKVKLRDPFGDWFYDEYKHKTSLNNTELRNCKPSHDNRLPSNPYTILDADGAEVKVEDVCGKDSVHMQWATDKGEAVCYYNINDIGAAERGGAMRQRGMFARVPSYINDPRVQWCSADSDGSRTDSTVGAGKTCGTLLNRDENVGLFLKRCTTESRLAPKTDVAARAWNDCVIKANSSNTGLATPIAKFMEETWCSEKSGRLFNNEECACEFAFQVNSQNKRVSEMCKGKETSVNCAPAMAAYNNAKSSLEDLEKDDAMDAGTKASMKAIFEQMKNEVDLNPRCGVQPAHYCEGGRKGKNGRTQYTRAGAEVTAKCKGLPPMCIQSLNVGDVTAINNASDKLIKQECNIQQTTSTGTTTTTKDATLKSDGTTEGSGGTTTASPPAPGASPPAPGAPPPAPGASPSAPDAAKPPDPNKNNSVGPSPPVDPNSDGGGGENMDDDTPMFSGGQTGGGLSAIPLWAWIVLIGLLAMTVF